MLIYEKKKNELYYDAESSLLKAYIAIFKCELQFRALICPYFPKKKNAKIEKRKKKNTPKKRKKEKEKKMK